MPKAHRHGDLRQCGATTNVTGQSTVYVNSRLWSVVGDPNSHIRGYLIGLAAGSSVFINGINVIVHAPDPAGPDDALHPPPPTDTGEGSSNVYAYG